MIAKWLRSRQEERGQKLFIVLKFNAYSSPLLLLTLKCCCCADLAALKLINILKFTICKTVQKTTTARVAANPLLAAVSGSNAETVAQGQPTAGFFTKAQMFIKTVSIVTNVKRRGLNKMLKIILGTIAYGCRAYCC